MGSSWPYEEVGLKEQTALCLGRGGGDRDT